MSGGPGSADGRRTSTAGPLRRFYQEQLHLQRLHIGRHDVCGLDAVTAQRTLRWRAGGLTGDLLPRPDGGRSRPQT